MELLGVGGGGTHKGEEEEEEEDDDVSKWRCVVQVIGRSVCVCDTVLVE